MNKNRTRRSIWIVLVIFIFSALVASIVLCRSSQSERFNNLREKTMIAIEEVDLSDYDDSEKESIKALIEKYLHNVEDCTSRKEVNQVFSNFKLELGEFVTLQEKLTVIKQGAIDTITGYDLSKYDKDGKKTLKILIDKYCGKVRKSKSAEDIDKIIERFRRAALGVQTKVEKEEEKKRALEKKKKQEAENSTPAPKPSKTTALKYVGKSASQLISAIGYPSSTSYAPSCLGEGEDGVWHYPGFTVYTYKEGGKEIVQGVQ